MVYENGEPWDAPSFICTGCEHVEPASGRRGAVIGDWAPVFLYWPRRIQGRWLWLTTVGRIRVCGGCSFYGEFWWEYRP
jgi:hypothetical protein